MVRVQVEMPTTRRPTTRRPDPADHLGDPAATVRPFRQFILKIHGRCNLACDYCYVYEMADQRWRERARAMSRATVDATAERIAEHARAHRLPALSVVLHGGEPLLAGKRMIAHAVRRIRAAVGREVQVGFGVQTNGTLLDSGFLTLLRTLDVRVAVSLDGGPDDHDRHRRARNGAGSYEQVLRGVELLTQPRFADLFSGLLCTVDLAQDPVVTLDRLAATGAPAVDFLLPHGNWSTPPPGRTTDPGAAPYGDWLVKAFDRWYLASHRRVRVRIFEEIMHLLLGGESRVEGIGLTATAMAVIETDGSIEGSDMLTSTFQGAALTGLDVIRDSFDTALTLPMFRTAPDGRRPLPTPCRSCRISRVCGAGLSPHRYRDGAGFDNPSVYCPDLYRLITHVRNRMVSDLTPVGGLGG